MLCKAQINLLEATAIRLENENQLVNNFKEHFNEYKSYTLEFNNYSRFMLIGIKNEKLLQSS